MAEIIIKSSVAIAVSYLLYFCFLRNNTRFGWIRIYFLVAVAASLVIPILSDLFMQKQETWVQIPAAYLPNLLPTDEVTDPANVVASGSSRAFSLSQWLPWLYFAGATMVLLRFVIGLAHLFFLTIKFGIQKDGTDRLVILHKLPYPFSFLHLIFIDRQTLLDGSNGAMLQHERAHVQQWHSLDLLVLELLVAFQWFNPFAWLFRRSVKELHEYLADEEVLRLQSSSLDYQLLLFNQACGTNFYQPVNGFKSSLTKKRILMITNNNKTKRWFAAFISLIVVIVAIQSLSRVNIAQDPPKTLKPDTIYDPLPPPPPPPAPMKSNTTVVPNQPAHPYPFFKGTTNLVTSNEAFGEYISRNMSLPVEYKTKNSQGETITLGIFIVVTYNKNGEIIDAEKGFFPDNYLGEKRKQVKYVGSPRLEAEVIKVIKTAPRFTINEQLKGSVLKINYILGFDGSNFTVRPMSYLTNNS